MHRDDLFYDFDRDAWIETPGIHARWNDRELPAAATPPSPGAWIRPPNRFRKEMVLFSLLALGIGLMLVALSLKIFALVPIAMSFFALLQLVGTHRQPLSEADRRLLEDSDDLDVCLIDIQIVRNGRRVGTDRGVVWFEGGRILFSGHRTSFAIGGEDVLPRSQWRSVHRSHRLFLPLRVPSGRALVAFELPGTTPGERERRFVERLHAFCQRPPVSRGPRQWPPLPPSST